MAATDLGARLTRAQREAQLRLRAGLLRELALLWPLLDVQRLDETFPAWSAAVSTLVRMRYDNSAGIAARYLASFREAELGRALHVTPAGRMPARQLATSLLVTGPVAVKRLRRGGLDAVAAGRQAFVLHSGSASRLALAGGRQTINDSVKSDRRARGFERVTSGGNSCAFCEDLAGQGVSEDTEPAFHDHCACTIEPAYA